jgi:predicted ATPase
MHPAVQCSLGDVFIREMNDGLDKTFLLETHSEHLLLRMMKRMRQTSVGDYPDVSLSLTADLIAVVFVETYDSRSVFREMPLNERGEFIKAWPGGFFEEALGELM